MAIASSTTVRSSTTSRERMPLMSLSVYTGKPVSLGVSSIRQNSKRVVLIGGTSLSSPLSMGAWARIESADNNRLWVRRTAHLSTGQRGPGTHPPILQRRHSGLQRVRYCTPRMALRQWPRFLGHLCGEQTNPVDVAPLRTGDLEVGGIQTGETSVKKSALVRTFLPLVVA
jgi:hypothetical protein